MSVATQLDLFVEHYTKSARWLHEYYDEAWSSDCEVGEPYLDENGETRICWQPVRRENPDDFAGVERALELEVHADIKTYYGRYWAGSMAASAVGGPVSLIFLWNTEDIGRLTENIIGHALAQKQSRSPFSVFFATTSEDSDYFLSVRNDTGEVQLELPGKKPIRTVAPNLAYFLEELSPMPPST